MPDNIAFVQWGTQPALEATKAEAIAAADAKIQGYTQTAMTTTAINLLALASREVAFTSIVKLEPGSDPELQLIGGAVVIPASAVGRWSPTVIVDATVAALLTVEIRVFDAQGALVGTVETTDYPAKRAANLVLGSGNPFSGFRPIGHLPSAGPYTVRVYVAAGIAANLTKVQLALTKLP